MKKILKNKTSKLIILILVSCLMTLTARSVIAENDFLTETIKQGDVAPYSGVIMSENDFKLMMKHVYCCEKCRGALEECVDTSEGLFGNPWFVIGITMATAITTGVIVYSYALPNAIP